MKIEDQYNPIVNGVCMLLLFGNVSVPLKIEKVAKNAIVIHAPGGEKKNAKVRLEKARTGMNLYFTVDDAEPFQANYSFDALGHPSVAPVRDVYFRILEPLLAFPLKIGQTTLLKIKLV